MSTPLGIRAWQVQRIIAAEVERQWAERLEPIAEALALIERAQTDLAAGWPEAAGDALARARALLAGCTMETAQ